MRSLSCRFNPEAEKTRRDCAAIARRLHREAKLRDDYLAKVAAIMAGE
jgi:hypothetical protein